METINKIKSFKMKNIIIIIITLMCVLNISSAQSNYVKKPLRTEAELYEISKKYGLEDNIFDSNKRLLERYRVDLFLTDKQLGNSLNEKLKWFTHLQDVQEREQQKASFDKAIVGNISSIKEFFAVLSKYPAWEKMVLMSERSKKLKEEMLANDEDWIVFLDQQNVLIFMKKADVTKDLEEYYTNTYRENIFEVIKN
jgi:hypothetical protein